MATRNDNIERNLKIVKDLSHITIFLPNSNPITIQGTDIADFDYYNNELDILTMFGQQMKFINATVQIIYNNRDKLDPIFGTC